IPVPGTPGAVALRLPDQVADPPPGTPDLPSDHGVGPAVIAYRSCSGSCPGYLMLADGAQYRLRLPSMTACCASWAEAARDLPVSLSPDGRWLAVSTGHEVLLRDLITTDARTIPLDDIVAWSPNDRFVLGGCVHGRCRLDLHSRRMEAVDPQAGA